MIQRIGLLLVILISRFYALGVRPPHHDEAVNGWFVDGIFEKGFYHYDPRNYHGPIFFYLLTFFEMVFGRTIEALRTPTVLFGIALTFTPLLYKRWIGERAAWIAAFFLAVSPACVFYSRYSIHETGFAFSCAVFLYFWLLARKEGLTKRNVWGLGVSLGVMASLKENFVLFVACIGIAKAVVEYFMPRLFKIAIAEEPALKFNSSKYSEKAAVNFGITFGIAAAIILISFTAFGRDLEGAVNFFTAFSFWSETGTKGNGHQKPFYYWLELLLKYEWLAFIGLILTSLALKKVNTEVRIISVLGFGLWLAYSIVSYKTPWCLLSFYFLLIMVAAFWISKWMQKNIFIYTAILLFGFCFSGYQAYLVSYVNVDADDHPYIYGQTYRTFMPPLEGILQKYRSSPEVAKNLRIQIISKYTWPLPWVLGETKQTAYHTERNPPDKLDANYLLIDADLDAQYSSRIVGLAEGKYVRNVYRARQWAAPMVIYERVF